MYLPHCLYVFYMPTFVQFLLITVAQVTLSWQIINLLPSKLVPWRFLFARHSHAREIPATNLEVRMRSVLYRKLYLYVQCGVTLRDLDEAWKRG